MSIDLEQFCQAIDIIVSERLSDLSFDNTIICTIMDASDKERGHYVVSDGTIRFDAYTNDTSYKENDQVRVSILNGNFNERKFIEGPYIGDNSGAPVNYISPLGTAVPLEENAISKMGSPQNISSFVIYTNTDDEKLLWEADISNDKKYQILQENGIYNTITLSADFMTDLGNLSQGNYGLVLDFFIKKDKDSNSYTHRYVTLDSSEMIGNPYSFEIYSHQEKKINIAAFGTISMIRLSVYEGVQFTDNGRLGENRIENPFIDNNNHICGSKPIIIRNIKLGFGNDLISITDNALQLYTTSPIYYNYVNPTSETNEKTLGLLWLNKNDKNEYVGYSDGLYDRQYDEITYRKLSNQNSRLTAQMNKIGIPDDESSLTLAANIAEAEQYMIKAYDMVTTELSQVLQALDRQLTGAPDIADELKYLIHSWDSGDKDANGNAIIKAPMLNVYRETALQATSKLVSYYSQILNYGYNVQNQITPNAWNEAFGILVFNYGGSIDSSLYIKEDYSLEIKNKLRGAVNWEYTDYYLDFVDAVTSACENTLNFFDVMKSMTAAGKTLNGYSGICDMYLSRAKAVIKLIYDNLDRVHKIFNADNINVQLGQSADIEELVKYKEKETYVSYKIPEDVIEEYHNKYCIYWYQYQPGFTLEYSSDPNVDNTEYLYGNFAGANWVRIPEKNNVGLPTKSQLKDDEKEYYVAQPFEEDYITTLHMDPRTEYEKIKVIMFKNHEMISSNIIEFNNIDDVPEDKEVDPSDTLRIEHDVYSQDHYQVYTSAYDLANIADGSKMRQLKCFYDGVLSGDETMVDGWLYWYIPTNATLLTYDRDYLVNTLGFITDIDQKTEYSLDNYIYFAKKVEAQEMEENAPTEDEDGNSLIKLKDETRTFVYKIKSFYEPAATNNTILAKIRLPGYQESVDGEKYFTFSTFGNSGTKYTFTMVPGENKTGYCPTIHDKYKGLSLHLMLKDAENNLIKMVEGIPSSDADKVGHSLKVEMLAPQGRSIPEEQYNEIDNSLLWNIYLWDSSWDNKSFIGILKASVSLYNDVTDKTVSLQTLYPVPYAANPEYYISGPTVIVYNNQGTVSRVSEAPYQLFRHSDKGDVLVTPDDANSKIVWSIEYYNENGTIVEINKNTQTQSNIYSYMPKLNADNTLTPAPLYFSYESESAAGRSEQYYPVVKCENVNIISGNRTLLWSQPIVIIQNKYACSTLNNWDGTFTIDEANGTLMAAMLGAGKKTANNTFEGVLIGDIYAGDGFDPDNASGIGIYGFNDGDQSFHFGTDGTAFLGKSGRGRIVFDGNSGTIASASYESTKKPIKNADNEIIGYEPQSAGMLIDLDDGFIDIKGASTTGTTYNPKIDKLEFSEYNKLWEPGESHPSYEDYLEAFDADAKSTYHKQAHIRLDVTGDSNKPYFLIHSAKQIDNNKHLMFIGHEEYYLQTDDYETTKFDWNDGGVAGDGAGFKLDLTNSLLDAYKLKVTSKNLFLNSTSKGSEPYFVIKHNEDKNSNGTPTEKNYKNLMYVGSDNYYLQSANYIPMSVNKNGHMGQGMRLDLAGDSPRITAYNFDLRAGNTGYGDHQIILSDSGSPYLQINTAYNNATKTLVKISKDEQYLQSSDFSDSGATGIQLSLSGKRLKAYSGFTLQAYKGSGQYVLLDATATSYPLKVYGSDDKYFQVNWDGGLEATGANIKGTINATGGTISGDLIVTGSLDGGTISGATILGGTLDIGVPSGGGTGSGALSVDNSGNLSIGGNAFQVTNGGALTATSGTIGGWTVSAPATGGGSGFSYGQMSMTTDGGLNFGNGVFTVGTDGLTTIKNLKIVDSVVLLSGTSTVFSVNNKGDITFNGDIDIGGHVKADGEKTAGYDQAVEITVDTPNYNPFDGEFWTGTKLTFRNGLLMATKGETETTTNSQVTSLNSKFLALANVNSGIDEDDKLYVPTTTGNLDEVWASTGSGGNWKKLGALAYVDSIKKKVNITMSGSYTVPMSEYYTRSGPYTAYTITDKTAYSASTKYYYCKNGKIHGPYPYYSNIPSDRDDYISVFVADQNDKTDYVVVKDEIQYYTTSSASNITLNLTGSKTLSNQEFEASDTDDDIDFNVSNVTFTKVTT